MPLDNFKSHPKRPRITDRNSYNGHGGYFITINTFSRKKYFINENIVKSCIDYLKIFSNKNDFSVIVYCFMPDHLHLVLRAESSDCNLEKFITTFKQKTAFQFSQKFNTKLWATSYYDHVLRKEESIKDVGMYTLQNPVKAGLVDEAINYPYNGSFTNGLHDFLCK